MAPPTRICRTIRSWRCMFRTPAPRGFALSSSAGRLEPLVLRPDGATSTRMEELLAFLIRALTEYQLKPRM